jgi:hypothetical protein
MTAEIAVMNRQGVALAADSAVTVGGEHGPKIFSSVDKIFELSKHEPVAVMIYGKADFMLVPWETVLKVYRERLGTKTFDHLEGYLAHLLGFLKSDDVLFTPDVKRTHSYFSARSYFHDLRLKLVRAVNDAAESSEEGISAADARRIVIRQVKDEHDQVSELADGKNVARGLKTRLSTEYADAIEEARAAEFGSYDLPKTTVRRLVDLVLCRWTKADLPRESGLVVAGFGRKDTFPRLISFELDGVLLDHLIGRQRSELAVSPLDQAFVHGFAQADMIQLFMEGVAPEYEEFVEGYVERVVADYGKVLLSVAPEGWDTGAVETVLRDAERRVREIAQSEFAQRREKLYTSPVLDAVSSLPKDELGLMAESLVTLTSLKRRISMDHETVGGPVDVAVITKGDGLVWTKKKWYFDASLNHHFFANYFRRRTEDV